MIILPNRGIWNMMILLLIFLLHSKRGGHESVLVARGWGGGGVRGPRSNEDVVVMGGRGKTIHFCVICI
jgi:hypothetical protein